MLLEETGPFTIAGLRYLLGAVILLPLVLRQSSALRKITSRGWLLMALLGIASYAIGNGIFFLALQYLPTTTASFMMGLKPVIVLTAGIILLREFPTRVQVIGFMIALLGTFLFFKNGLASGAPIGLLIASFSMLGYASFGILGRSLARGQEIGTLLRTAIPLAIGGGIMLMLAIPLEGLPHLSSRGWGLVLILAVVNTVMGYLFHNYAIKTLYAFEMDIFLSLAPIGTAVLAWLLLDEVMPPNQIAGMLVVIAGVGLVQAAGASTKRKQP